MRKLDNTDEKEKRTTLVGKGGSGDPTLRYLRDYEAKRVEGREDLALRISIIW